MTRLDESNPNYHVYKSRNGGVSRPGWAHKHDGMPTHRNLLPYLEQPHLHKDDILRESKDTVTINDKFPKGQVHLLVLPKWQPHRDMHPSDAFEDSDFLGMIKTEVALAIPLAIETLRKQIRKGLLNSGLNKQQAEALLIDRDFRKDLKIGTHAHPSQHELHVHIISRDGVGSYDYGRRHYRAFNTPFFVPLELYPLPPNDLHRDTDFQNNNLLAEEFQCWRCGRDFDDDWPSLKTHLREEMLAWFREGNQNKDSYYICKERRQYEKSLKRSLSIDQNPKNEIAAVGKPELQGAAIAEDPA